VPDVFSRTKRSWVMSRIHSFNTGLEAKFLSHASIVFYRKGFRYRKHCATLPGKPDIAFHKQRVAVFIDGDFWHGYNLTRLGKRPPNLYWKIKIEANMRRDRRVSRELRKLGWRVLRIWEHDVERHHLIVINRIIRALDKVRPQ